MLLSKYHHRCQTNYFLYFCFSVLLLFLSKNHYAYLSCDCILGETSIEY